MSSADNLRHIVEYAQDLIDYRDVGGRFTYVNPAAARVMGWAEDELLGRRMQPHVPFFSTKDPSRGTGLGLSIVYGIAKEAGGAVTFTSAPNQGTTFEVILPLAG